MGRLTLDRILSRIAGKKINAYQNYIPVGACLHEYVHETCMGVRRAKYMQVQVGLNISK